MSGSNTICVVTALLETGTIPMREPETLVTLETAAGLVRARATCRDGRCERVTLDGVPSFVEALDVPLHVPGFGDIEVDIAYGGCYYVLADVAQLDLELTRARARERGRGGHGDLPRRERVDPGAPSRAARDRLHLLRDADRRRRSRRGAPARGDGAERPGRPLALRHGQLGASRLHGGARSGERRQPLHRDVADRQHLRRRAGRHDGGRRAARRCCRASRAAAGSSARVSPRSIRATPTRSATCSRTCGGATSPRRQRWSYRPAPETGSGRSPRRGRRQCARARSPRCGTAAMARRARRTAPA